MRRISSKPQARAMSVALDDHGDMVPGRGTTNSFVAAAGSAPTASPDNSRLSSRSRCASSSGESSSMKYVNRAARPDTRSSRPARELSRRDSRKSESADWPSRTSMSTLLFVRGAGLDNSFDLYALGSTGRRDNT